MAYILASLDGKQSDPAVAVSQQGPSSLPHLRQQPGVLNKPLAQQPVIIPVPCPEGVRSGAESLLAWQNGCAS